MAIRYEVPEVTRNTTSKTMEALKAKCKLQEKSVEYAQNAEFVVTPDEGFDGLSKVNVSVDVVVPTVQNKKIFTAVIGKNIIKPDPGFDVMEEVEVTVNPKFDITQAVVNLCYFPGSSVPSNVIGWENLVEGAYKLSRSSIKEFNIPTPKLENGSYMFYNNVLLETFSGDLSALVTATDMFAECTSLKNVTLTGSLNVDLKLNTSNSIVLTKESVLSVINALVDLTGSTAKTQTFGTTLLNLLTEEEKAIATNKNWILK